MTTPQTDAGRIEGTTMTARPPTGYWCCALDWNHGWFRASDCIGRTRGPEPQWERIEAADVGNPAVEQQALDALVAIVERLRVTEARLAALTPPSSEPGR